MKKHAIRFGACVCSIIVIVSCFCVALTAQAATLPVFSVSSAYQVRPGDTVSFSVDVNENRGYCAGEFVLEYDADVLTPVGVVKGDAASEYFVSNTQYGTGKVFFAVISTELMSDAGTVATVTFTAKDDTVLYNGDVKLSVNSLVGNISVGYGLNSVKSTANSGEIYIAKQIFVADALDSTKLEELRVAYSTDGLILGATTFENLIQADISDNFGSIAAKYFDANGATLSASAKLSTGCKITVGGSHTLTVSVREDVNGDYSKDGEDAFIAKLVASEMLSEEDLGSATFAATDADGDGDTDYDDYTIMEENGLKP